MRRRRKALGWTRREFAARTDISERFLADVETGRANPSVSKLVAMAAALGCEPAELLADGRQRRVVALVGLRGAGKSTVGRALAASLAVPFEELDRCIEGATGLTLDEIFQVHGEAYFRRAEYDALNEVLRRAVGKRGVVLACGGGLVTAEATFARLRAASHTVWLRAEPADHWRRVVAQGDTRPMADNDQAFADLCSILRERDPLYRACDLCVDTSALDRDGAVARIREYLAVSGWPAAG